MLEHLTILPAQSLSSFCKWDKWGKRWLRKAQSDMVSQTRAFKSIPDLFTFKSNIWPQFSRLDEEIARYG